MMFFGLVISIFGCNTDTTEEEKNYDEQIFVIDCQALQEHFVTAPTSSVDYWTGYWECFQENNGCSGESCSWSSGDLPSYVTSGDCQSAETCSIDGQEVQECTNVEETGYVSFDCSTDGSISIVANGLPDHTIENYSSSGILPPLLGSSATNTNYTLTTEPVYNADSDVFDSGGGTLAISVNSVSIFNQFTGIGTVAVTDETVDDCGGHPANGTYHYHAFPYCGELANNRKGSLGNHSGLTGMSLDGFPVFGPYGYDTALDSTSDVVRMESCYAQTECDDDTDSSCYVFDSDGYASGDCHLDKCNGRVTVVPDELQAALGTEIYAYYMTVDESEGPAFPYLPYCYRGDVESGNMSGGTGGGPPPQ
jgi:hypothetical protein